MAVSPRRVDFAGALAALQALVGRPVMVVTRFGVLPLGTHLGTLSRTVEGGAPYAQLTRGADMSDLVSFGIERGGLITGAFVLSESAFDYAILDEAQEAVDLHFLSKLSILMRDGPETPLLSILVGPMSPRPANAERNT